MKKLRVKTFDYFMWAILAIVGILFYFTQQYFVLLIAIPFLLFYLIIWFLRLLLFYAGRSAQVPYDDIHPHKLNTSGWIKSRAKILEILPSDEIVDEGIVTAKFVGFKVKVEKYDGVPMVHELFINNVITPLSYLNSLAINSEAHVLIHPHHKYVAVFDPEVETWILDKDF